MSSLSDPGTSAARLGAFLRARRARRQPTQAGLVDHGTRRVSGLRRDEVADLAGVSESYYSRMERGEAGVVSDAVLEALARALALDADERAHLMYLARPTLGRRSTASEIVDERTRRLLEGMPDLGAAVIGPRTDILAWNVLGHRLLAGHLPARAPDDPAMRPNLARLLFLDARSRDLYVDWSREAHEVVGYLRLALDQRPDDDELLALIDELTAGDRVFAELWARHPVNDCHAGDRELRHPLVGTLQASRQLLGLPDDPGQRLLVLVAAPGESAERIAFLKRLGDESSGPPGPG